MTEFYLGDERPELTARERMEDKVDIEPALCRTCHDPIDGNGDEDHDQCFECRLEAP